MDEQPRYIHLYGQHMCGRVVKFRILDQDEVDQCELNGAEEAGQSATHRELRKKQLMQCVRMMLVAYTDKVEPLRVGTPPGKTDHAKAKNAKPDQLWVVGGEPDPESLAKATWHLANAQTLLTQWKSIFGPKDTEALKMLYAEHHELHPMEVAMLSGKAKPFPAGA